MCISPVDNGNEKSSEEKTGVCVLKNVFQDIFIGFGSEHGDGKSEEVLRADGEQPRLPVFDKRNASSTHYGVLSRYYCLLTQFERTLVELTRDRRPIQFKV